MVPPEWTRIFKDNAASLEHGDSWHLEFDSNIVPDQPNMGWKQYIRNTSARFKCTKCGRSWPSNKVKVVFHMQLVNGQGTVKARPLRQNCKMCSDAPMEMPQVDDDNIEILMENLMEKIQEKCYNKYLGPKDRPPRQLDVKSPHEPAHCEACQQGICTEKFLV